MTLPPGGAATERSQGARGQGPNATAAVAPVGHPPPAGSGGCPERPRLTKAQRDALYDVIDVRLYAIDDVRQAIDAEKFPEADKLAREYADLLRLIVDDLGWGAEGEAVELRMPAEDLRRAFGLFHERAARAFLIEQPEEAEARVAREENQLVLDACKAVLMTLDVQAMRV